MAADLPDPPPVWRMLTAHTYLGNGRRNLVTSTVFSKLEGREMSTTVEGGPLDGQGETLQVDPARAQPDLRLQHIKWAWRVVNADVTHPEWWRKRRREPPTP